MDFTAPIEPDMTETNMWIDDLRLKGRKENTIATHRGNIKQCLRALMADGRSTKAAEMTVEDIQFLWKTLKVKEEVRHAYLRSLSNMVMFHTRADIVKEANILYNREVCNRVFIDKDEFRLAFANANQMQRLILCLGAYMGLRRNEMANLRDSDIRDGILTIHGKGHGESGLVVNVRIPVPVLAAIDEYNASPFKAGIRSDDYLIQSRGRDKRLHRIHAVKISDAVTDLARKVGIRMTTHSLRRFYATMLYYDANSDLQTLKNLMRHANINTTLKCYVDAYDLREREASERLTDLINWIVEGEEPL